MSTAQDRATHTYVHMYVFTLGVIDDASLQGRGGGGECLRIARNPTNHHETGQRRRAQLSNYNNSNNNYNSLSDGFKRLREREREIDRQRVRKFSFLLYAAAA